MGKKLFGVLIVLGTYVTAYSQGSGKTINFGSGSVTNPSVTIKNTFPNLTTNFTITAWIKTTNNTKIGQRIFQDDANKTDGYGFSLGDPGTGRLRFYSRGTSTGNTTLTVDGTNVLANNTWYHVAAVINITSKTISIYENGVLDVSASDTRTGTFGTDAGQADFGGEQPGSGEAGNGYYIYGNEDEIIVWDTCLTQTEIRNIMCCKQTGSSAKMYGYWNLDGAATGNNNVPDLSTNGYTGTMSAGMLASDIVTSGAALGDYSQYVYSPGTWTGLTITLPTTTDGQIFSVSSVTGTVVPTGMQVYQVNSVPSITTGITGIGTNNVYFGVYVVNGTAPTYSAKIDYTAYDKTTQAQVFYRVDNSTTPWTAGNTNTAPPPYSITQTLVATRKEFILGASASALPIQLLGFDAICNNNTAVLTWSSANEINNDHYTIERTQDGMNYETVATVKGAGNSDHELSYSYTDNTPLPGISYYRLSQTDFDGTTTELKTIVFVPCSDDQSINAYAYNNTINTLINYTGTSSVPYKLMLMDALGRIVITKNYNVVPGLNVFKLPANQPTGIYLIRLEGNSTSYTRKVVLGS
jgi:hypothetical protein